MPTADLLTVAEVAKDFLGRSGYLLAQLDKTAFDHDKNQWVLTFDVGFSVSKLKKVTVDGGTMKVIALE